MTTYYLWRMSVIYRHPEDGVFERWDADTRRWVDAWDDYGLVVDGDMDLKEIEEGQALALTE